MEFLTDANQIAQHAERAVVLGAAIVTCTLAYYWKKWADQW